MALPLLPIIGTFAPWLARQVFGDGTGELVEQVTKIASDVFGTDDPEAIEKAIATDPAKALEFKRLLLDMQDRESQRQHEMRLKELDDVQNARGMYAQSSKVVDSMTILTVAMFFVVNGAALYGCYLLLTWPGAMKVNEFTLAVATMVGSILTYVNSKADTVWGFFFGSSHGSKAKTDAMGASITEALKAGLKR